ncbi:sulfatase family protein [Evansella halocellulosilytica]|uniref:sulfatase family protein n=1 Tax=Evansella halocellulosilytica TaxID=2011013 RepID=UPI000BB8D484|nr:sulfatase [Evansella halocellulosilytica]
MAKKVQPNIVYIITHDTGTHLGCYGKKVQTPAVDELAENGVRFDNYFCSQPQCSPSRGSILTGKYSHNHGMMGLGHLGFSMNENNQTLPGELSKLGYETHLFGFFHEAMEGELDASRLGYEYHHKVPGNPAKEVTDTFIRFLENSLDEKKGDQPLFLSLGFEETHRPFDAFEQDDDEYVDIPPYLPDTPEVREDIARFQGSVKEMDKAIKRITDAIEEYGLQENTIVIFTTDHGIAFPRAKGTLKDSGLETALIMKFPEGHEATKRGGSSELLCNVDLMPTIMEIVGGKTPNNIDGHSFYPLLQERDDYVERENFFCELTWHDKYHPMRGVRTKQYKYIRNFEEGPSVYLPHDLHASPSGQVVRDKYYVPNTEEELYDLEKDPVEEVNVADHPEYKDVLKKLRQDVIDWMEETNDPLLKGPIPGKDAPEWEEEIKAGRAYNSKK